MAGTAPETLDAWVAFELRGKWASKAVESLPDAERKALKGLAGERAVRIVGIKSEGRAHGTQPLVMFRADANLRAPSLSEWTLDEWSGLLGLLPSPTPRTKPLFLVCTHGKRDVCCAREGWPIYERFVERLEHDEVWQSTHLGGHRFAPNVLVLPAGILYGRVTLDDVDPLLEATRQGRFFDLDKVRGRCSLPAVVQFAEVALRKVLGMLSIGALESWSLVQSSQEKALVELLLDQERWHVEIAIGKATEARQTSCDKPELSRPTTFALQSWRAIRA